MEPNSMLTCMPGGGGALRYRIATYCPTAAQSESSERQNIRRSTHLKAKKGEVIFKLSTKVRVVTFKMCLFSLDFVKYIIFIT